MSSAQSPAQEVRHWLQRGDRAFTIAPTHSANALLSDDVRDRHVILPMGYLHSANTLAARSTLSGFDRDTLVSPLLFLYRQFIELSLKAVLAEYGPRVGVPPNWSSHLLPDLWRSFVRVLKAHGIQPDEADEVMEGIIGEFSTIDPNSYSFRYAVDTKGQPIPVRIAALDVDSLAVVMGRVETYFSGCVSYLHELSASDPNASE